MNGKRTLKDYEREVKDVISDLLNDVSKPVIKSRHVHVFRKEYRTCLIRGCYSTPSGRAEDSRYG